MSPGEQDALRAKMNELVERASWKRAQGKDVSVEVSAYKAMRNEFENY